MGQHKFNPNCEKAKNGKLTPKKQKGSKADLRSYIEGSFPVFSICKFFKGGRV